MSYSIKAEGISKRYDLNRNAVRPNTLVETIDGWFRRSKKPETAADGEYWALRDLSFEIQQGDAVGVIGRNGAGKSTLLKILSRVTDPTEGVIRLRGRVASLLEVGTGFHGELSGRENVYLNGAILGMKRKEIARRFDDIIEYADVARFVDVPVKRYSSGMYMRLAFAVAAFLESEILIVDEVLAVGDQSFQEKCLGTMRDASNSGRTVLFVSHNMTNIARLTRRCLLMDNGSVVFDGDPRSATERYVGIKQAQGGSGRRPVDEIVCMRRLRGGSRVVIAEMGLAAGQAEEIPVGGRLRMEFLIESDSTYVGLRIAYSINSAVGQCVLTGISEPFKVRPGRQLLQLDLTDLYLVPGSYDFSVNLGSGQLSDPKGESDSFIGFGYFRVIEAMADGQPFGAWHSQWASLIHRDSSLREVTMADTSVARKAVGT